MAHHFLMAGTTLPKPSIKTKNAPQKVCILSSWDFSDEGTAFLPEQTQNTVILSPEQSVLIEVRADEFSIFCWRYQPAISYSFVSFFFEK